jgi:hypothetical protein
MTADAVDAPSIRPFLAIAMRLAGVHADDEALATSVPLVQALLGDWALLARAATSDLEPMPTPRRPAAAS